MPKPTTSVDSTSLAFVERLYLDYLERPDSVSSDWQELFASQPTGARPQLGPKFVPQRLSSGPGHTAAAVKHGGNSDVLEAEIRQERVAQLVRCYRERGHLVASIDPLSPKKALLPELLPEYHGLSATDMDRRFSARTVGGPDVLTLRQILERLRNTYCRSIGVQFMHIADLPMRDWLRERMEVTENRLRLSRAGQLRILTKLTDAVMFEEFLQTKYLGAKSFSLEGSESLIPLLAVAIDHAGESGINEVVLAMAHRGRLNVLANIMGKRPRNIFREFEDRDPELDLGSGDVKYHLGHATEHVTPGGRRVALSLCFNPSHLEFVNPVALGRTRARQDIDQRSERRQKLTLLIHGDAALAGEGITQETLNLSELTAYTTGGTLHVVVNNQIGFTTPPNQGRSTEYATDVAKMLAAPIFHVNGEDPEAVAQVVQLALDFREAFGRDVFIDMYGYRRRGHNEGDEPTYTQPLLYAAIANRKSVRDGYLEHLLSLGEISRDEAERIASKRRAVLDRELAEARSDYAREPVAANKYADFSGPEASIADADTTVRLTVLSQLLQDLTRLPESFRPHRKIAHWLEQRREMARSERRLDWGAAEALAFASLATSGYPIRFTGQDCERGTFSHRHAVLHDVENGECYVPLCHLAVDQATIELCNSPLSEAGVLGFEYGYSLERPHALTLWEAQFGDFFNAAQVTIDQFIVSGEDKWKHASGLVLLLPHGYEGMGPEHSSARIERWLALAAEENIQLCQPTTPAQMFHLLRRQVLRPWRKPLVIFTPKSLLRHPVATSELSELSTGCFQRVLSDNEPSLVEPAKVRRILLCSGKLFYVLAQARREAGIKDIALIRIEQFYPLPDAYLEAALKRYLPGTEVFWTQEEPDNMGACRHLRARFGSQLFSRHPFACISRAESASPATGSARGHRLEQEELLKQALDITEIPNHVD